MTPLLSFSCYRYDVALNHGFFQTSSVKSAEWFHVAVIYYGPSSGTALYYDGSWSMNGTFINLQVTSGAGTVHIGMVYINLAAYYGSVMVDELSMWNRPLMEDEVAMMYKMGQN